MFFNYIHRKELVLYIIHFIYLIYFISYCNEIYIYKIFKYILYLNMIYLRNIYIVFNCLIFHILFSKYIIIYIHIPNIFKICVMYMFFFFKYIKSHL